MKNDLIVLNILGVAIHLVPFRGYYWPRNTHLDNPDKLPREMGTADFEKKSLGTNFFYFSKASYRVKCFLFYGFFFHWGPWKKDHLKFRRNSNFHSVQGALRRCVIKPCKSYYYFLIFQYVLDNILIINPVNKNTNFKRFHHEN